MVVERPPPIGGFRCSKVSILFRVGVDVDSRPGLSWPPDSVCTVPKMAKPRIKYLDNLSENPCETHL